MDLAEFRHMIGHAGPVRGPERWVLYTIIPVSLINSDEIEIRPPYLTSVPTIMDRTGIKTADREQAPGRPGGRRLAQHRAALEWDARDHADGPGDLCMRLPGRRTMVSKPEQSGLVESVAALGGPPS
jgi:hypothetical protein